MRILIYSHDTFGLGHYRRCLKIARRIAADNTASSVLILTGSPLVDRYPLPDGVDSVKLPAVIKVGREEYRSRSSRLSFSRTSRIRSEIICATASAFIPDVVLIDHAPLGLQGEARMMLEHCASLSRRPYLVLGLRDIIDHPDEVVPLWRQTGVYEAMETLYDRILIYGARDIYDPVTAYAFPDCAARKTTYVGYICDAEAGALTRHTTESDRKTVVVTVGGGEDGQHIVDAYLAMIARFQSQIDFDTVLLPGPLLSQTIIAELQTRVGQLPVRIEHFVPEIARLLSDADLVVAMGGYNTVAEILTHARRAIIIPRETPRREQLIRAQQLHSRSVVKMLRLDELTADRLHAAVQGALETSEEWVTEAREAGAVPLDGAQRVAGLLNARVASPREVDAL